MSRVLLLFMLVALCVAQGNGTNGTTLLPTTLSPLVTTPPPTPTGTSNPDGVPGRPLSAAVRETMIMFDYERFIAVVAESLNITEKRLRIITYSPTVDPNVIIVDFGVLYDNQVNGEPSSDAIANQLVCCHLTLQPLMSIFTVDSIQNDPTLAIPEESTGTTPANVIYRSSGNQAFIILTVLMCFMFLLCCVYLAYYFLVGRHDRSLYANYDPAKTWLSLYSLGHIEGMSGHPKQTATRLNELPHVSATGVSESMTMVVTRARMFCMGPNRGGELGMGHSDPVRDFTIHRGFFSAPPLRVVCGDAHTLALCVDGVYSFGSGENGALGHGNYDSCAEPKRIKFFDGMVVRGIAAGENHSVVLTNEGLYTFGFGEQGQLLHNDGQSYPEPTKVEYFAGYEETIRQIVCGANTTFILANDWELYAAGSNEFGQLCLGHRDDVWEPTLVDLSETTSYVYNVSTWNHTLIACDDGLYCAGEGDNMKLGLGRDKNQKNLQWVSSLEGHNVISATAGRDYSIAVTDALDVFAWGFNAKGKICPTDVDDVIPDPTPIDTSFIPQESTLAAVMAGPTFTLFLIKDPEDAEDHDEEIEEIENYGRSKKDKSSKKKKKRDNAPPTTIGSKGSSKGKNSSSGSSVDNEPFADDDTPKKNPMNKFKNH